MAAGVDPCVQLGLVPLMRGSAEDHEPIEVAREPDGPWRVQDGQHRFIAARSSLAGLTSLRSRHSRLATAGSTSRPRRTVPDMREHLRRWGITYILAAWFRSSWSVQLVAQPVEHTSEQAQHVQPFEWAGSGGVHRGAAENW